MATEKSPLLASEGSGSSLNGDRGRSNNAATIVSDELPPPHNLVPNGTEIISCNVCNTVIDISGKTNQHVVKCTNCNEATPVRNAPPGKKYVRCPCNCLLICKLSSESVACPRTQCKRILKLGPRSAPIPSPTVPGMCQVTCGHCFNIFLFNTLNDSLARCPHCRQVSSVGAYFARRRAMIFLTIALIIFIVSAIVIGTCYHLVKKSGGYYVILIGLPLVGIIFLIQAIRFFTMKMSHIEGPV